VARAGGGGSKQPTGLGAEAGRDIDGHQAAGPLALARRQQALDRLTGGALLAGAEQGIDPEARVSWIRAGGSPRQAQPEGMAPVGLRERFAALEWSPEPNLDAGQVQLPGHHQPIAAVVARPHQHQHAIGQQGRLGEQPPADQEGRLLHQGFDGQPAGEQLHLQGRHLVRAHQQVGGITGWPGRHGNGGAGWSHDGSFPVGRFVSASVPTGVTPPLSATTTPFSRAASPAAAAAIERLRAWPGEHRVAVGLSGGVDSSLSAALLVEAGWQVEGITLWLMSGKGACCAEGLVDAAGVCEQLGVPHHVVDSRAQFQEQIVDFLVEGYAGGVTPLPCSRCNREVKFTPMLEWAWRELGITRVATGHYARLRPASTTAAGQAQTGRIQLLRGLDASKDQSYFLYDLPQSVLSRLVFPLGELTKVDTRLEAERQGLRTAHKPESQDLCLADHHGSMKAFLDAYLPPRQGEIVLADGTVIGRHDGLEHFTIGQRKGLGVAWSEPLHVVRLDAALNRVVVAPRAEAARSECCVGAVNWVSIAPPARPIEVAVQVRYRSAPVPALLSPLPAIDLDAAGGRPHRCQVVFSDEQFSITPGQAAVFYDGEVLLGGGLIQAV